MQITTPLSIPIKCDILNQPVFYEEIKVGKITNSYIKDNRLWIIITLNNKKIKTIKKLCQLLRELKNDL